MEKKFQINASMILGIALVLLGLLFLAGRLFNFAIMGYLWPLIIVAVGGVFFAGLVRGGRQAAGLAFPASIITMIGLILLFCSLFNAWAIWAYAWALIVSSVGIGMLIFASYVDAASLKSVGRGLIGLGLLLFVAFGAFFELLLGISGHNQVTSILWAVALIGLGAYVIFGKSLFKKSASSESGKTFVVNAVAEDGSVHVNAETVVSEERALDGEFTALVHKAIGDVEIVQGDHCAIRVDASDNVREHIRTEIKNGELVIYYDTDWTDWTGLRWMKGSHVRFYVTMQQVEKIHLAGLGDIKADGINTTSLNLIQSGAGSVRIKNLHAGLLETKLSGLGSTYLSSGEVETQKLTLSGAGSYYAADLKSQISDVRLSGAGSAEIWVETALDAKVSGAGSVRYKGAVQQVNQSVSGVGSVKTL